MDIPAFNVPPATSKRCGDCDGLFSMQIFTRDASKKDGKSIYCQSCQRRRQKAYKKYTPEKQKVYKRRHYSYEKSRDYSLRSRYGMTLIQFNAMFEAQGRKCALCRSDKSDGKNFVVDHSHKTGKVRGILCSYCNRALGMLKDDVEILKKAIAYLGDF